MALPVTLYVAQPCITTRQENVAVRSTDMELFSHNIDGLAMNPTGSTPRALGTDQFIKGSVDTGQRGNSILSEMEDGFRVDLGTTANLKKDYELALSILKDEVQEKVGRPVRVDSNTNLSEMLFEGFGLPALRVTPKGNPSITLDVLERLSKLDSDAYPFLKSTIEFKKIQTLLKSLKTISKKLDPSARIHPEFNHSTCPTGRIYSYIQNLPKKVREVLIPDKEENVFIELDWSQQELRILAALSQEPVFLDCFARNEDLHRRVISEMFHKPIPEVIDVERRTGKTINYALIYGQEAPGLALKLNVPLKKAQELIDQYFSSLPTIRRFKVEMREKLLTEGCAETVFGRKTALDLAGQRGRSGDVRAERA